ncbi:unnamed protein product [Closterium sp. NIES-54]
MQPANWPTAARCCLMRPATTPRRLQPSSLPLPRSELHDLLSLPPGFTEPTAAGTTPPLLFLLPGLSQTLLPPNSPLPAPACYSPMSVSPTECREPESSATSPGARIHLARRVCPSPVPIMPMMAIRPSSVSQPVVQPLTVTRCLTTLVTGPTFFTAAASALVAELLDFAATCRLDYLTGLVSDPACPTSAGGELALGYDVREDRQFELEYLTATSPHLTTMLFAPAGDLDAHDILTPRSYAEAIMRPYSSQWQTAMDAKMAS